MADKPAILVVDDEEKIREVVKSYLETNGFQTLCAKNGKQALELFASQRVDLVLLDLMLPDLSGEDICKKIRSLSMVPIIMLTAKVDEASIIHGLNIGADDYITKPFSPRELVARVKAVVRRSGERQGDNAVRGQLITCGELTIDTNARTVKRNGAEISLTPNEYKILTLLASRPEKIFTRDEIIDTAFGDEYGGFDRAVDTHIKNLRAKIADDPKNPRYILTVYGMGYRFHS
jgi:DNA-binding response OmpR family regulator